MQNVLYESLCKSMTSPSVLMPENPDSHTYESALAYLKTLNINHIRLGLERIQGILDTLGNPQDTLPMVHITGSNGKGSTAVMLSSILQEAGYRVGLYTSPHLVDVRERIKINGQPIPKEDFAREILDLRTHLDQIAWPADQWPTYFEFLNILAYPYFKRQNVDLTVFEVGLGGRLDSTNVVKRPLTSVITGISLEHTDRLGTTLSEIAFEKAGILKPNVPAILGPTIPAEARAQIHGIAARLDVPVYEAVSDSFISSGLTEDGKQVVLDSRSGNRQYEHKRYKLNLLGPYQRHNLAVVLQIIEQLRNQGYEIPAEAIHRGLTEAHWPARFEYFPEHCLLVDGSHNLQGFESLQEGIARYFSDRPLFWLLSLRNNRNPMDLINTAAMFPNTQGIFWTAGEKTALYHAPAEMAAQTDALFQGQIQKRTGAVFCQAVPHPLDAFRELEKRLFSQPMLSLSQSSRPLGIITGSLYTAGKILEAAELWKP